MENFRFLPISLLLLFSLILTGCHSVHPRIAAIDKSIAADPYLRFREISVEAANPQATTILLNGEVASIQDKIRLEELVRKVKGIKQIKNEVTLATNISRYGTKEDIALARDVKQRIEKALKGEPYSLEILASSGEVTLGGRVSSDILKSKMSEIVSQTPGVLSIQNRCEIIPPVADEVLASRIVEALKTKNIRDIANLEISTDRGRVFLGGAQRSDHTEADQIIATVLNVDGVVGVESDIYPEGYKLAN